MRYRIRTLMIVVSVVAMLCVPGMAVVRWYMQPKPTIRFWHVRTPYVSPGGKVWEGGVIYIGADGEVAIAD